MSSAPLSSLSGRVAVVTGASRGIGRAVALELARSGVHVIAVARTQGALEELDDDVRSAGGATTLVPADLTDFPAIDRLGYAIYERWKKLDILVGNAGILGPLSPLGHVRPKDFDAVMDVNLVVNWRLVRSLDPLLRLSDAGRAVFVTSGAARSLKAYWGPYSISKAALEAMVKTYAAECDGTAVRANLFNPGPIRTDMRAQAMPGEDPATLKGPDAVVPDIIAMCAPSLAHQGRVFDFPSRSWM